MARGSTTLRSVIGMAASTVCVATAGYGQFMFWAEPGGGFDRIQRANLDGADEQTIVISTESERLEVDTVDQKLYWIDKDVVEIQRANFDGTSRQTVLTFPVNQPHDLAIDSVSGKLYWTEDSMIRRANLDGTNVETILDALDGLVDVGKVAVDSIHGQLYWGDWAIYGIRRSSLDGVGSRTWSRDSTLKT